MNLPQLLGIVGVTVLIGVVVGFIIWQKDRIRTTWTRFAEQNGLEVELGTYPLTRGEIDGRQFLMGVTMGKTATGRPKPNRVVEFEAWASLKGAIPEKLVAGRRGWLDGPGPVQTGDRAFDKAIYVACPDREAALSYLTDVRREALRRAAKEEVLLMGPNEGEPAALLGNRLGYKVNLDWLEGRKALMLELADALDG